MNKERSTKIQKVTIWGAVCNLGLSVFKIVGGIAGHSAAMIADAVHSLSDLVSDLIVILFAGMAGKSRDKGHDYGHGKFETLATAVLCIILLVAGGKITAASINGLAGFFKGETAPVPGMIALIAAAVSILVKEALFRWTRKEGEKLSSPVMIANAWHHRTDALSSIGSLIGIGGAILLGGKWVILDSIAGLVISIVIIVTAVKMAIPAVMELTDASLPENVEKKILSILEGVEGILDVHELKTRSCGPYEIIEAHIVVNPDISVAQAHSITVVAEDRLHDTFGPEMQISLHVEPHPDAR